MSANGHQAALPAQILVQLILQRHPVSMQSAMTELQD
jgi:hypothetical protein